jgi:hypothetical protein
MISVGGDDDDDDLGIKFGLNLTQSLSDIESVMCAYIVQRYIGWSVSMGKC